MTKATPCTQNSVYIQLKAQLDEISKGFKTFTSSESDSGELIDLVESHNLNKYQPFDLQSRGFDIRSARTFQFFTSRIRSQSIPTTLSYRSLSAALELEAASIKQFALKTAKF